MTPETKLIMHNFGKLIELNFRLLHAAKENSDKEVIAFVEGRFQQTKDCAVTIASVLIDKKFAKPCNFGKLRDMMRNLGIPKEELQ